MVCSRNLPSSSEDSLEQLEKLNNEEESLNNSLLALTSHFAQVQFRLKQILQSEDREREGLLKELEEFAFSGCQELSGCSLNENLCLDFERRLALQKAKHEELIYQLKFQLEDLEKYAKQTSVIRTDEQLLRHKLILDNLRKYLHIDINDIHLIPHEELQTKIEEGMNGMLSPLRSKEQMLYHLTTQVQDLERFIEFLHGNGTTPNALSHEIRRCTCDCPLHGEHTTQASSGSRKSYFRYNDFKKESMNLISKTLFMLQVFLASSVTVIGYKPATKPPPFMSHVRRLEESVDALIRMYCNTELTTQEVMLDLVRSKITLPLKMLLAHGLRGARNTSSSNLLLSCTATCTASTKDTGFTHHPWRVFLQFYKLQHGHAFTEQPLYQLSQSFGLRIHRQSISSKQSLLSAIYQVKYTHDPYKRNKDSKFKALVLHGVNEGKLGQWCRVLSQCHTLHEGNYEPWSYMSKHGFADAIKILDRLSSLRFDLPTDVALKQFQLPADEIDSFY